MRHGMYASSRLSNDNFLGDLVNKENKSTTGMDAIQKFTQYTVPVGALAIFGLNLAATFDKNDDAEQRQGIDISSAFLISLVFVLLISKHSDVASPTNSLIKYVLLLAAAGIAVSRTLQITNVGGDSHGSQISATVALLLIGIVLFARAAGQAGTSKNVVRFSAVLAVVLGIAVQWNTTKGDDQEQTTNKVLDVISQVALLVAIFAVAHSDTPFLGKLTSGE